MRLGIFTAVSALVLMTLLSAFPQVITSSDRGNTADHMAFTRELADNAAKLDALKSQHDAMASQLSDVPIKIARIEERLDLLGRMVYAILGGIFALLAKEIWAAMQTIRSKRSANGDGG